jgi:membrane-bound lytic murein transglycosylase D
MRFLAVVLIFFGTAASQAQTPQVPHKMHFANMTLAIRDDARREIQKDVDGMTKHARYFNVTADRARLYFPLVSKIFAEEGLPDDFKYLCLQESALVADAVSVSNAVGFWQFKDFTALSVGMRVDKEIDERMNIASATRGAASYLKKNNQQFDNWILALQAYQMGAGGVRRAVGDRFNGKRHFEVTSETYWYIKKFIAHKVAFENAVDRESSLKAVFIQPNQQKTIAELAREVSVDEELLKQYNKWILKGYIPSDKAYVVTVPSSTIEGSFQVVAMASKKASKAKPMVAKYVPNSSAATKSINGVLAIKPSTGETLVGLSSRAGISLTKFLSYNEIQIDHTLNGAAYYFMGKKKNRSEATTHKVKLGDDLWSISQQYGVKLKRLKKWNREMGNDKLMIGSIIWLTSKRVGAKKEEPQLPLQEVISLANDSFNWEVKPPVKNEEIDSAMSIKVVEPAQVTLPVSLTNSSDSLAVHRVTKGDTFYSIAKQYQVAVVDLVQWNDLTIDSKLFEGQNLKLPSTKGTQKVHLKDSTNTATMQQMQVYHLVKESDTLYGIARQYGVTIKELMAWNDKKELTIKPGEKLIILKK